MTRPKHVAMLTARVDLPEFGQPVTKVTPSLSLDKRKLYHPAVVIFSVNSAMLILGESDCQKQRSLKIHATSLVALVLIGHSAHHHPWSPLSLDLPNEVAVPRFSDGFPKMVVVPRLWVLDARPL